MLRTPHFSANEGLLQSAASRAGSRGAPGSSPSSPAVKEADYPRNSKVCAATPEPHADFIVSFPPVSSPGAFPVSAHRSQLPKGPGGVFPRHPHQQELPERSGRGGLLGCTERFPGKLIPPRKASPSQETQPFPGCLPLASSALISPTFIYFFFF